MKALLLLTLLQAQPAVPAPPAVPPPQRADFHVVAGWQNLHEDQPQQSYDNWMNGIFYAGAGAGWYWTPNLKTQIDFGAGTEGRQYRYEQIVVGGSPGYQTSRLSVSQQSLAIGQQYQFFRNAWFHPHLGGGVDLAREKTTTEFEASTVYDPVTRVYRQIVAPRTEDDTRFVARPFVQAGFKAYMTRQAFFTADTRVKFLSRVDEVLFRFGFGVDF